MLAAALDVDRRGIGLRQATFESKTIAYVFGLPFGYTSTELAQSLSLLGKDVVRLHRRGAEQKRRKAIALMGSIALCLAATPARSMEECGQKLRGLAAFRRASPCGPQLAFMLEVVFYLECHRWAVTFTETETAKGPRVNERLIIDHWLQRQEIRTKEPMDMDALAELRWYGKKRDRRGRAGLAA